MDSGVALLTIFILSIFVGFEVVSKVSTVLHTPLMSGANAIHGIVLVGAILVTGSADSPLTLILGLIAIVLATINLVGGFVVTDRMLEMFKAKKPAKPVDEGGQSDLATRFRGTHHLHPNVGQLVDLLSRSVSCWRSRACRGQRPRVTETCSERSVRLSPSLCCSSRTRG